LLTGRNAGSGFRVQGRRSHTRLVFKKQSGSISRVSALSRYRESVLHLQFTGPNPLDHRDDEDCIVDSNQ